MASKTLPTLNPTAAPAADTLFLVRRNGQLVDEKLTGADLQTFIGTNLVHSGGTIDNAAIGGTTPAAGAEHVASGGARKGLSSLMADNTFRRDYAGGSTSIIM